MRGDLPHRAEHQERKRDARRHAQAALAARASGGADVNGGNGVGHGGPSCASAIADAARVGGLGGSGKRAAVRHLRPPRGGILLGGRSAVRRRTSNDSSDHSATSAIFLSVLPVLHAFRHSRVPDAVQRGAQRNGALLIRDPGCLDSAKNPGSRVCSASLRFACAAPRPGRAHASSFSRDGRTIVIDKRSSNYFGGMGTTLVTAAAFAIAFARCDRCCRCYRYPQAMNRFWHVTERAHSRPRS